MLAVSFSTFCESLHSSEQYKKNCLWTEDKNKSSELNRIRSSDKDLAMENKVLAETHSPLATLHNYRFIVFHVTCHFLFKNVCFCREYM